MREHGYVDGQNVTFVERWAEGRSERFPELIDELLSLKVNVIVAVSVPAALAAKNGTTTIPIVFIASDPLGSGLVPSLARPAGNLTGFSLFLGDEFSSKWLELLKEAVPNVSRVAILWNPMNPASAHYVTVLRGAAEKLGVMLHLQAVSDPDQFDGAFATMVAARAQALVVVVDPLNVRFRERIVELAMKNRFPAMYRFHEFVDAGGLLAYGVNAPYLCRRAAANVEKILKGAKPAELPVEQPTKFELVVNLKTAKASASRSRNLAGARRRGDRVKKARRSSRARRAAAAWPVAAWGAAERTDAAHRRARRHSRRRSGIAARSRLSCRGCRNWAGPRAAICKSTIAGRRTMPSVRTRSRLNWSRSRRMSSSRGRRPRQPLLQMTRTVPIVFVIVTDPVGAGLVESLARPGGNATGFARSNIT